MFDNVATASLFVARKGSGSVCVATSDYEYEELRPDQTSLTGLEL